MKDQSEESAEGEKQLPVLLASERLKRERKTVERYSVPLPGRSARFSASKVLSIEKGRGTQLKDIPNVAFKLSKRKTDDNLQALHTILFGRKAKAQILKTNIGQFSGYVWPGSKEKQRAKVKQKLDKCVKERLMDFCDVLNIPICRSRVKKEELSVKLLEFLESPHVTTDILLGDKEQKGQKHKRKVNPSKTSSSGEASAEAEPKIKRLCEDKQKEEDDVDKVESSDAKDESHDDDDNKTMPNLESDHEEEDESKEEEDKPKEHMFKSLSKEVEDQGKGQTRKKACAEPSKEEMHDVVVEILKRMDLDTITLPGILNHLGIHFGGSVNHRKAEVKEIMSNVLKTMDEESAAELLFRTTMGAKKLLTWFNIK